MNKTFAGMIGALAIIAPVAVMAAPANPMAAASYADMLKPAPTASGTLEASNATLRGDDGAKVELVQYFGHRHHHHGFHRGFRHRGFFHRGYHRHHRHFF